MSFVKNYEKRRKTEKKITLKFQKFRILTSWFLKHALYNVNFSNHYQIHSKTSSNFYVHSSIPRAGFRFWGSRGLYYIYTFIWFYNFIFENA